MPYYFRRKQAKKEEYPYYGGDLQNDAGSAEQFAIDADEISMDSSFVDDLGADSVDLVELVMAMEEEFDIGEIDEEDLAGLKTVGDCVRYLNSKLG